VSEQTRAFSDLLSACVVGRLLQVRGKHLVLRVAQAAGRAAAQGALHPELYHECGELKSSKPFELPLMLAVQSYRLPPHVLLLAGEQ
jgi:hypothetical protein